MEIDGHPTQDLIEELERRGAVRVPGSSTGPDAESLSLLLQSGGERPGSWLFLGPQVFDTGLDEQPW
jgi:hypothetical protein